MSPRLHRLVPAVIAVGIVLPTGSAGAQSQDLRSPDARSATVVSTGLDLRSPDARTPVTPVAATSKIDLRSPDARLPVTPADTAVRVDLRSPDAVDGQTGSRRHVVVPPTVIKVSAPVVDGGFQWGDAGLGAGIIFALLVLPAGGYALMVAHRRSAGGAPLAH